MQAQDKEKERPQAEKEFIVASNIAPDWPAGIIVSKKENMSVSVSQDLAVVLADNAFKQLFGWAYSTSREISCLGSVSRYGNIFLIERFYLLKQSGSSASTELEPLAIATFLEQMITEGKKDEASRVKCWAHSHPNMNTFWSKTDDETCRLLVNDYLISIVVSNDFAVRCRIDIAAPVPVVLDNIPVLYRIPQDKLVMDKYADEVRNAVQERVASFPTKDNKQVQQNESIPTSYCDYCGNWHAAGECPLGDAENWPQILDDEFIF